MGTAIAPEHFITDTSQAVIKESADGKVTTVLAEGDYKEGGWHFNVFFVGRR